MAITHRLDAWNAVWRQIPNVPTDSQQDVILYEIWGSHFNEDIHVGLVGGNAL
jgi:hypothetical protein